MWNRRDSEAPGSPSSPKASAVDTQERPAKWERPPSTPSTSATSASHMPAATASREGLIGKSICIRGELTGNEDLTIEGKVEGKIDLMEHNLTIGPSGRIEAEVGAKTVVVQGQITGDVTAGDRVELTASGRVKGDILAPRVVIADGAHFKGMVNMTGADEEQRRPSNKMSKRKEADDASSSAVDEAPVPAAKSA